MFSLPPTKRSHRRQDGLRHSRSKTVNMETVSPDNTTDSIAPPPLVSEASAPPPPIVPEPYQEPPRGTIAEWTITILLLLFLTTTLVQAFVIPTGSMEDTLLIGDHLLVDKLAYAPAGPGQQVHPALYEPSNAATSSCSAIPWTSRKPS